ncbi:hypothetical protein LSAT2_024105 [Lamellibrachia satsuma]|nr:hypothetical protein LSAT2_024105 [Lamellibrachia satsuma]
MARPATMAAVAPECTTRQTSFRRRTHPRVCAWALTALLSPATRRPFTPLPLLMQPTAISGRQPACRVCKWGFSRPELRLSSERFAIDRMIEADARIVCVRPP